MSSSVIEAFKKLNMLSAQDVDDHKSVFEVSYQYLSKVKNFADVNSFHNCIVALINLDRYYKALILLHEVPESIHAQFPVEKAYVYYKTGNFKLLNSLYETLTRAPDYDASSITARALRHVMAQSLYQNGHISESLALYKDLITSNSVDNELDMACNERAILSQLAGKGQRDEKPILSVSAAEKSYDYVFNNALRELLSNNKKSSLTLLDEASSMCLEQNMDTEAADLALEIAPIKLTKAYIYQIQGETAKALAIMKDLDMASITDLSTKLIFKNNYILLTGSTENVNFAARELNYKDNLHHLRHKLTKPQFRILIQNHLLLAYQTGTLRKSSNYLQRAFFDTWLKDFEGDVTPLLFRVLLTLGYSYRDLQLGILDAKALGKKLYRFCMLELSRKQVDDKILAAAMLLVHFNSQSAKYEQAMLVFEQMASIEFSEEPENLHASVFGTLINMYEVLNNAKKLDALYTSMFEHFKGISTSLLAENRQLYEFLRAFALKLFAGSSRNDEAYALFKLLQAAKPNDNLLASVLTGDLSGLTSADELASPEDVETLLAVNVDDIVSAHPTITKALLAKATSALFKVTKKAKKPKFSKNKVLKPEGKFDPEKDLDKERWLPLKLRSYYKPSKKELKKKSGGHQGAVELSPAPTQAPTTSSSSSKSKNKKKKKGKK